jgi:hypothetical protein
LGRFKLDGEIHYLRGFSQGLLIAMAESSDYLPNATIAESVKGLDQFYEDPANAAIPITYALKVFKMKVSGATPEKLASEAATYRGLSAAAGELLDK